MLWDRAPTETVSCLWQDLQKMQEDPTTSGDVQVGTEAEVAGQFMMSGKMMSSNQWNKTKIEHYFSKDQKTADYSTPGYGGHIRVLQWLYLSLKSKW